MTFDKAPHANSEQEGAALLFNEVSEVLVLANVNFVVVGGWVPWLFHSQKFGHPGTFDVDVLIHADSIADGTFAAASELLLKRGYLRAPKNRFQAHRIIHVGSEFLVFHVDFLNEQSPTNELDLVGGDGKLMSIYTPSMQSIFRYENYRTHPQYPNIKFPSVETFIATKAAAVSSKKRNRDAFDVFVSVADQNRSDFTNLWRGLVSSDGLFADANNALVQAVDSGDAIPKVMKSLADAAPDQSPDEVEVIQSVPLPSEIRIERVERGHAIGSRSGFDHGIGTTSLDPTDHVMDIIRELSLSSADGRRRDSMPPVGWHAQTP